MERPNSNKLSRNIEMQNEPSDFENSSQCKKEVSDTSEGHKYRKILEPVTFIMFFAQYFQSVVVGTEMLRLTCEVVYGYDPDTCHTLAMHGTSNETQAIEEIIQPYTVTISTAGNVIDSILSGIISLFLGAFSDQFGRKPVLVASCLGFTVKYGIALLLSLFGGHPWWYILVSFPSGLVGGVCTLLGTSYSYISDVSTPEQRPIRLSAIGICQAFGIFLGSIASGFAFEATSAPVLLAISTILTLVATVYLIFIIDETVPPEQIRSGSKIRSFFEFDLVKDMWRTLTKRREYPARIVLTIGIISLCAFVVTMEGSSSVTFMYFRKQFSWSAKDVTIFTAINIITMALGMILGIGVLQRLLKLRLSIICMIALALGSIDCLARAFVTESWELYLSNTVTMAKSTYVSFVRSIISNIVLPEEIGKIFAIATTIEFTLPLAIAPLYTLVYTSTLSTMPGAFNFISFGFFTMCFLLFIFVYILEKRYNFIKSYGNRGTK